MLSCIPKKQVHKEDNLLECIVHWSRRQQDQNHSIRDFDKLFQTTRNPRCLRRDVLSFVDDHQTVIKVLVDPVAVNIGFCSLQLLVQAVTK